MSKLDGFVGLGIGIFALVFNRCQNFMILMIQTSENDILNFIAVNKA